MVLKDSRGNNVVFTTDRDIVDYPLAGHEGMAKYRVRFPAKLFKPGFYFIRIMLIKRIAGGTEGDILSDNDQTPLSFEIFDFQSRRSSENRYSNAIIAPELDWNLIKEKESSH